MLNVSLKQKKKSNRVEGKKKRENIARAHYKK